MHIELTSIRCDCVTSEFLKFVVIKIMIFLDVILCSLVDTQQSFTNTC